MTNRIYDAKPGMVVLSADQISGLVAPGVLMNHVTLTKIYGDGTVVFIDPSVGSSEIRQGQLDVEKIIQLLALLKEKGFLGFSDSYFTLGLTDLPTNVVTATWHGEPKKHVACYGGALSAPPGFMECYQELLYPRLAPSDIKTYVRQPIGDDELAAGWYYGFEYQKKLNTPRDWVWVDAGRSSKWQRPEKHTVDVTLDSGYMIPPVDGCRHIRIHYSGDPASAGSTIQFDRNAMTPNSFGAIGMTSLMYFAPRPATFTLLQQETGKRLFSITVAGYLGPKLRLVVLGDTARPSYGRLLVLDAQEVIQNIHTLQIPTAN